MSTGSMRPKSEQGAAQQDNSSHKGSVGARKFARQASSLKRPHVPRNATPGGALWWAAANSPLALGRTLLDRVPVAARVCALVAFINAACWSLITPPFQVPDEPDHFAYVQQLAEAGRLPTSSAAEYSPEEGQILRDLRHAQVRFRPEGRPIFSQAQQRTLHHDLSQSLSRVGGGGTGFSSSEPPLYYALETIPYGLASSGSILDRLELMRLMSALIGGFTALFAFLFVREALPGTRWAWTVGGLGVALTPLLGSASGGVTPDALLFAIAAALFFCLARAFRRGLSTRRALAIGALIALGLVTKLNFVGLVPGAILGLLLLAIREARTSGRAVYTRALAPALAVGIGPGVLYALVNTLSNHATFGFVSGAGAALFGSHSPFREISYIWQLYLPRLPGMPDYFGELFTTRQIWFRDLVGLYGWNDTPFPEWAYSIALIPAGMIVGLCMRAIVSGRAHLWRRWDELLTYGALAIGLLLLIGASGYLNSTGAVLEYAQPRYLLPLLALWGGVLALAARGAGRRWGPVVGVLIVVLALGHDIFSQLQVISRYYS